MSGMLFKPTHDEVQEIVGETIQHIETLMYSEDVEKIKERRRYLNLITAIQALQAGEVKP
jgi:hypothetical protein